MHMSIIHVGKLLPVMPSYIPHESQNMFHIAMSAGKTCVHVNGWNASKPFKTFSLFTVILGLFVANKEWSETVGYFWVCLIWFVVSCYNELTYQADNRIRTAEMMDHVMYESKISSDRSISSVRCSLVAHRRRVIFFRTHLLIASSKKK